MEAFIGTIIMFGGKRVPRGWLLCDGSILPIAQHQALFSMIGTAYGGDGRVNFGLPDFRARVPMGFGQGPGTSPILIGQRAGSETSLIRLDIDHLPSHTHQLSNTQADIAELDVNVEMSVSIDDGMNAAANNHDYLAKPNSMGAGVNTYRSDASNAVKLNGLTGKLGAHTAAISGQVSPTGGGESITINNMQPYQSVNFIICDIGLCPSFD